MVFLFAMTFSARVSLRAGMAVAIVFGVMCLPPMYWVYSYWGGCVAATGGAAVLLATEFYRRGHTAVAGAAFAAGALALFLTRPYEGAVFTLAAVAADAWLLYKERGKEAWLGISRFLTASVPIMAAGVAWSGYYNFVVTGNALELPRVLYDGQFAALPNFWFLEPRDLHIPDARLNALQGFGSKEFELYASEHAGGFFKALAPTLASLLQLFGLTLPLLIPTLFAWRTRRVWALAAVLVVCFLGFTLSTIHFAHYAAPCVAAAGVVYAWGIEAAWQKRIANLPAGAMVAVAAVAASLCLSLRVVGHVEPEIPGVKKFPDARANQLRALADTGDEQVVVVRYPSADFQTDWEWVHNRADIDSQQIVSAHDLGDRENAALRRYYPNRKFWLLTLNGRRVSITPYEPAP